MKQVLKTAVCALAAMCICLILLTAVACIPQRMIQKQSKTSAEYFSQRLPFQVLIADYINAVQDNYSDTVLCDIAYCIDEKHPFRSVIEARYVQGDKEEAYEGLLAAVKQTADPNREYGRYWHGSLVFIRPLLMIMPIGMIRILCGTMICMIQVAIISLLIKRRQKAFACCYIAAFILIHPWMLFTSLEFGTAFLIASGASLAVILIKERLPAALGSFFAVVGVVTAFADFLTTETLTFTLPMLLIIAGQASERNEGYPKQGRNTKKDYPDRVTKDYCMAVIYSGVCWGCGYLGMIVLKVILLIAVAGKDTMIASVDEAFLRVGGEVHISNWMGSQTVDFAQQLSGAIWHNLACLYPTHAGVMESGVVWLTTGGIIGIGMFIVYLLHEQIEYKTVMPMAIIAVIPFIRYLVLSNHSYIHFFITYRAMMVTIAVFIYFLYDNSIKIILTARSK